MSIKIIEGDYQLASARFGLAVARFNSFIVDRLLEGALDALQKHGVMERDITVVKVPGAYELPLAVKMMLDHMAEALAEGERIEIRGFGSFSLHYRAPRLGRNPKTGEKVELAGKYVPHFKPGKELRERVNSSLLEEIGRAHV